ncbi:MAG: hypothetical protein Q4D85_00790 [Corynebacterium sp.]|uniref:hypothetical protein n=1 Tax=Corynebacterium sp. TaxID=1720 RepID=UPI0026DD12CF|nr:hypothetical protein [Corynebacterium sp.]MDO5097263.1 hypothetical protein [Corynebacterium sp.]
MTSQLYNHKLFRLICIAAVVCFSVISAFWSCLLAFSNATPRTTAALQIASVDAETSSAEIFAALQQLSDEHGYDISVLAAQDLGGEFALYTTNGQSSYDGIWPGQTMAALPIDQLPAHDPRVTYVVEGASEFHQLVRDELTSLGATVQFIHNQEWSFLLGGDLGKFLALGVGTVICAAFFLAFAHAKGSGIARLHGHGIARIVLGIFAPILVATVIVLAVSTGIIGIWRGFDIGYQFGRYVLVFSCVLLSAIALTLVLSMGLLSLTPITPLLKGRLKAGPVLGFAAVLRILMVGICLSWASLAIAYNTEYRLQTEDFKAWQQHPTSYKTYVNGALDADTVRDAVAPISQQLRAMSSAGELYYHNFQVKQARGENQLSAVDLSADDVFDSITYNRTTAVKSLPTEILSAIDTHPADSIVVIAPPTQPQALEDVRAHIPLCDEQPSVCVMETANQDYNAFSWQAGEGVYQPRAVLISPVVIVVPDDLRGISDYNVSAGLTNNSISFQSLAQLKQFTASDELLKNHFYQAVPLVQKWKENHDDLAISRSMSFVGLMSSLVLICIFGFAYGGLLVLSYTQRARNYRIFGLPPSRFYRKVAWWDLAVIIGSALLLLQKIIAYRRFAATPAGIFMPDILASYVLSPWAVAAIGSSIATSAALSIYTISRKLS